MLRLLLDGRLDALHEMLNPLYKPAEDVAGEIHVAGDAINDVLQDARGSQSRRDGEERQQGDVPHGGGCWVQEGQEDASSSSAAASAAKSHANTRYATPHSLWSRARFAKASTTEKAFHCFVELSRCGIVAYNGATLTLASST